MSETQEEDTQVEVQPEATGEDEVNSKEVEAVSSPSDENNEKPTTSERDEDKIEVNKKPETSSQEEKPTAAEPAVAKQPRKVRCFDPTDTVDIDIGQSGVAANKPLTVPQYFQITFDKLPDNPALSWKDKKEEPWKSLTYTQYKKLIYNVAKSLIKVMYCKPAWYIMYCVLMV